MEMNTIIDVNNSQDFLTNYKAVYQAMTAKHDCKSRLFPRNVCVSEQDLCDLNDRIADKLENYNIVGFSTSITASFRGRKSIEFSSWQEFETHKWNEPDALTAITLIWEFNIKLPKYDVPQKHLLVVKVTDGLKPEEMLNIVFAGKLENIDEIEKQICPIVARVDFINYILGDELLDIVEQWNKGLLSYTDDEKKIVKVVKKHRRKLAFLLDYVTKILVLICFIRIVVYQLCSFDVNTIANLSIKNINNLIWSVGILAIAYMLITKFSEWLANMLYQALGNEFEIHVFNINKGDENLIKRVERQNRKISLNVFISLIGTIVLNIFCNIISSIIIK